MNQSTKILTLVLVIAALLVGGCSEKSEPPAGGGTGGTGGGAQENPAPATPPKPLAEGTYEVGCHMCIFEEQLTSSCATAVKVGDEVLLVEGEGVPDAHTTGLCSASKQAVVAGEIRDGTVHATKFEVVE